MRRLAILGMAFWVSSAPIAAAEEADAKALIQEGVRLHDEGLYEKAIVKYRAALEVEPGNVEATYEIAYALLAMGKYGECVTTAKPILKRAGDFKALVYAVLGSCHDLSGEPKKAIRLLEKGLLEFPRDAVLAFNAGTTRARQADWSEARTLFKRTIEADPLHRSAHLSLGVAFANSGYRVQAILAFLRFLSLETDGPRAQGAALQILELLGAGFEKTGETEYTVEFNTDLPTDEGNYSAAELVRSLGGAVVETEEWEEKSAGEKLLYRVDAVLAAIDEGGGDKGRDFARVTYVPFVRSLCELEMLQTFVYQIFAPVGPPELQTWLDEHPSQVALLQGFLASQAQH